ncbi:MAG TPA: VCBS repeat-containing protein, partial [Candidatus Saccharimonadales bacterium]|nr:VCBS repeat-containing protein [Candidatus Saccharimonadales bacterium]
MVRTCFQRFFRVAFGWFFIFALALSLQAQAPNQQTGSARVPVPKLPGPPKKDRSGLPPVPMFKDVAKELGLTVQHVAAPEAHYVIDSTSGGAGLFDCDDDGRLDVVLINGGTVERFRAGGDPLVTLYHQEADGTFKDITKEAGLTRRGWGMGVAVADYDNDGKLDLFVTGFGGSAL